MYALRDGSRSAQRAHLIAETIHSGRGAPVGQLSGVYSHRPSELADELRDAGLRDVEVLPIGPGWILFRPTGSDERVDELLETTLRAARLCDGHTEMTSMSAHLLACGRR